MSYSNQHMHPDEPSSTRNLFTPIRKQANNKPTPLNPTTLHNQPSFQLHPSSPQSSSTAPKLNFQSTPAGAAEPSSHLSSTAPRIRARLTPSATPRKKVLPGTEFADPPPTVRRVMGGMGVRDTQEEEMEVLKIGKGLERLGMGETTRKEEKKDEGKGRDNVLVCVRVRPAAAKLASGPLVSQIEEAWDIDERSGRVGLTSNPVGVNFAFDSVVTGTDNDSVYQEAGRDLVLAAMEGFSAVIFAYGQTASGKTFTLSGNPANPGIIPQAVTDIFCYIRDHPEKEFLLRASYLEIYNETLKDLLAPESGPLKIRQDDKKRFFVSPLREEVVTGEAQVAALLRRGEENRHTGRTDFNERSSRSHSVFQITVESRNEYESQLSGPPSTSSSTSNLNGPRMSGAVRMSTLSLIDLAGSEQAVSQVERRNEGAFINKSLLTLEKVIASLTDDSKKKPHVPYRDSKLTQILQPSLSGDARVSVIATMNPSSAAVEETKSTLKFARRIKKVVLKAELREVVEGDKALIFKYRNHIAILEAQLEEAMALKRSIPVSNPFNNRVTEDPKQSSQIAALRKELDDIKSLFLRSENIEDRRHSMVPPRPVSPIKARRSSPGSSTMEEVQSALEETLLDKDDEIALLKEENDELKKRISELEEDKLTTLRESDEDKDRRIAELVKENRELQVINLNVSADAELRRMEVKHQRMIEKCAVYEKGLEATIAKERKKLKAFENYIIQHLSTQADLIMTNNRRISRIPSSSGSRATLSPSFNPLMAETSSAEFVDPAFVELEDLDFSEEGKASLARSGSMMFN